MDDVSVLVVYAQARDAALCAAGAVLCGGSGHADLARRVAR